MNTFPLKIGIVLNFKTAEKKKDELMYVNSTKRPWLKLANDKDHVKHSIMRDSKRHVPVDVALGLYLESTFGDKVCIDYITPDDISVKRFNQNDIVFLMQYDLLEAFHLADKSKFRTFKKVLETCKNVYPPYKYQRFINNKCTYYNYLQKNGIPTASTFCVDIPLMSSFERNPDKFIDEILSKVKKRGWEYFILKPVYGQEAFGFKKFVDMDLDSLAIRTKLKNYVNKYGKIYNSLIVQEYIAGFDKNNLEARTYFINGKYLFAMATSGLCHTYTMREARPVQEGGTFKISDEKWNYIKRLAKRVMRTLPRFDNMPSIITRIDIGSGLEGVPHTFFVNEVEFAPSFFIEKHDEPVIQKIGDALFNLAKLKSTKKSI